MRIVNKYSRYFQLLNCEYAVDLSTEVQYISIVKEGAISYQYSCGATEHGPKLSNLSFANYSARLINSSLSLVLSYDGISNTNGGNNCKSIPRHKGKWRPLFIITSCDMWLYSSLTYIIQSWPWPWQFDLYHTVFK